MSLVGKNCQSCVDNYVRALREAFLLNHPYLKARISSEMYQGIKTLQSLNKRAGRSFDNDLHHQRLRLVVLIDETGNIHYQMSVGLTAVPRGWEPPPLDEVRRP